MLTHVEMARHRVAKMQNTLEDGGDHGMISVNQEHEARLAALAPALDALPSISNGGTYEVDGEPDRGVFTVCTEAEGAIFSGNATSEAEAEAQVSSFLQDFQSKSADLANCEFRMGKACHSHCASCAKGQMAKGLTLQRCAKCHSVYYCSRECQVAHWPAHKAECKMLRGKKEPSGI
jgi:hypothetical protein